PERAADPCGGGAAELATSWSPARRAELERAFAAVDQPYAPAAAERVSTAFDQYATTWIGAHRGACEANRVRHVESDTLFDRRVACLEHRRRGFAALTTVLATTPSAGEIERSGPAALALAPVSDCMAAELRVETTPRPLEPARRQELAVLEERAATLKAEHDLGNYKTALADAVQLARDQATIDHPPLAVEVLGLQALLQIRTGDAAAAEASLRAALAQAARAGDDAEIVRIWGALIHVIGAMARRPAEALALVDPARIALVRAGSPPVLELKLESNLGVVQRAKGDLVAARASLERAIHLAEAVYGKDSPDGATTLTNYANVLQSQGEYAASLASHERVLATQQRVHGPLHPLTAQARVNVAAVTESMGDHARSVVETTSALAILAPAWGSANPRVLMIRNNLGVSLGNLGKTAEAAEAFEHVIATGHEAPVVTADALSGLAKLRSSAGEHVRAIEMFERCLALRVQHQGERHFDTAIAHVNLGNALADAGRYTEALSHHRRAIPLLEGSLGGTHPVLGQALAAMGHGLLEVGRRAEAHAMLRRARVIAARTDAALTATIDGWLAAPPRRRSQAASARP
ncbi:MAG: tetratricopeptide repeat protein, partial [Myxococcota bacterium]|nr:tetratricopeptide repeat protein [Myxococcota bacterium]